MTNRVCVICGAKVRNMNPRCNTCDPICTRAKKNGLTREDQIWVDDEEEEQEKRRAREAFTAGPPL
jgi:hypothetical protein